MIYIEPHDIMKGKINENIYKQEPYLHFQWPKSVIPTFLVIYSEDDTRLLNRRNSTIQQMTLDYSADGS